MLRPFSESTSTLLLNTMLQVTAMHLNSTKVKYNMLAVICIYIVKSKVLILQKNLPVTDILLYMIWDFWCINM